MTALTCMCRSRVCAVVFIMEAASSGFTKVAQRKLHLHYRRNKFGQSKAILLNINSTDKVKFMTPVCRQLTATTEYNEGKDKPCYMWDRGLFTARNANLQFINFACSLIRVPSKALESTANTKMSQMKHCL